MALAAVVFLCLSGCSKQNAAAKFDLWRAEELYAKAYRLKFKKVSSEDRISLYRESCDYFFKAHQGDPTIFTLNRIWSAREACKWAENEERVEQFSRFEEKYSGEHPIEDEFGDDMPLIF